MAQYPNWLVLVLSIAALLWLWSVVTIACEKTEDPYDRIVWLLIVLFLNVLGTFLYLVFGPRSTREQTEKRLLESEEEIKRRANSGSL